MQIRHRRIRQQISEWQQISEYSATPEAGVNCRGYDGIPLSARVMP